MRLTIGNCQVLKGQIHTDGSINELQIQINEEDFFNILDQIKLSNIKKYLKIRRNEKV